MFKGRQHRLGVPHVDDNALTLTLTLPLTRTRTRTGNGTRRSAVAAPEAGNLVDGHIVPAFEGRAKALAGLPAPRQLAGQVPADFDLRGARGLAAKVGIEGGQTLEHMEGHAALGGQVVQRLFGEPAVPVLDLK